MINKFGERFAELRTKHNVPRVDIATILNVSKSTVGFWERENRMPSFDELIVLSYLFNVSLDYLVGKTNDCAPLVERKDIVAEFMSSFHFENYKNFDGDYTQYLTDLFKDVSTFSSSVIKESKILEKKLDGVISTELERKLSSLTLLAFDIYDDFESDVNKTVQAIKKYEDDNEYLEKIDNEYRMRMDVLKEKYPNCSI